MEVGDFLQLVAFQSLAALPGLLFWTAAVIFATIMLRRGGGRAERLFVVGSVIKLGGAVLTIARGVSFIWWYDGWGSDMGLYTSISLASSIFLNIVSMAGILCLVYAFWLRFKEWRSGETASVLMERGPHDAVAEHRRNAQGL